MGDAVGCAQTSVSDLLLGRRRYTELPTIIADGAALTGITPLVMKQMIGELVRREDDPVPAQLFRLWATI